KSRDIVAQMTNKKAHDPTLIAKTLKADAAMMKRLSVVKTPAAKGFGQKAMTTMGHVGKAAIISLSVLGAVQEASAAADKMHQGKTVAGLMHYGAAFGNAAIVTGQMSKNSKLMVAGF